MIIQELSKLLHHSNVYANTLGVILKDINDGLAANTITKREFDELMGDVEAISTLLNKATLIDIQTDLQKIIVILKELALTLTQ